jgi:hypothetical protein
MGLLHHPHRDFSHQINVTTISVRTAYNRADDQDIPNHLSRHCTSSTRCGSDHSLLACIYALAEVIFAGYYAYLVRQVQLRPVGAKVPDDSRDAMVHRILALDISSSRTGNTPARGIDRNHTFAMTDLGSDTTLAEEVGRADGMSEKSEKNDIALGEQ